LRYLLFLLLFPSIAWSQKPRWQQRLHYQIDVSLDHERKILDGQARIRYVNNSPDSLPFIWFHLWPNAYKNDRTAFCEQLIRQGKTRFYFSNESEKGYIHRLRFSTGNTLLQTEPHPQHIDILKVVLSNPLAPGDSIMLETPFQVKLPYAFSRSGYINNDFAITQWYPKPAVYDHNGWHPMPYLDQGEFFGEFGKFEVNITINDSLVVAATGLPTKETKQGKQKTITYVQDSIHDFAWFASKQLILHKDTLQLPHKTITVQLFEKNRKLHKVENTLDLIKRAVLHKSALIGEYPYPIVSVVEMKTGSSDGMEYPTITIIDPQINGKEFDILANHEIGHNWFYGVLASNEREYPWMDEGLNTYYDQRYRHTYYPESIQKPLSPKNKSVLPDDQNMVNLLLEQLYAVKRDVPIESPSTNFTEWQYAAIAYHKAGLWITQLENHLGADRFDAMMQSYYESWKFNHPYPGDFLAHALATDSSLQPILANRLYTGPLEQRNHRKKWRLGIGGNLSDATHNHYLSFFPAVAFNDHDRTSAGLFIHNASVPYSKIRFWASGLYSPARKQWQGMGKITADLFRDYRGNLIQASLQGARFSRNSYSDSSGKITPLAVSKWAPALRWEYRTGASSWWSVQWKSFFFREQQLSFSVDSASSALNVSFPYTARTLHQVQVGFEDNRVLYPYRLTLNTEWHASFIRAGLTGQAFFNYPKKGGLTLRFFAGTLVYTVQDVNRVRYANERYHLTLSGANGDEDYTYSDYFIGRNRFDGWKSQQMQIRDGGFKIQTALRSPKVGKTDRWLAAINLHTTIPDNINPLSILPVKIPLGVFFDLGTFAEAWNVNAETDKWLYDAGIQVSLFQNAVQIYLPLLQSRVFTDYFRSTFPEKRFWRKVSFSIDLNALRLKNLMPTLTSIL
jgi:hypothetical protein